MYNTENSNEMLLCEPKNDILLSEMSHAQNDK